jgi:hypothetical protein
MVLGISSAENFAYSGKGLLLKRQIPKSSILNADKLSKTEKSLYASYSGIMHYIEQEHAYPDTGRKELPDFIKQNSYQIEDSQLDNLGRLMKIRVKHVFPESYTGENSLSDSSITKYITKLRFWGYRSGQPLDSARLKFLASEGAGHVYPCVVPDTIKLHQFVDEDIQYRAQKINKEYSYKYLNDNESTSKRPALPVLAEAPDTPEAPDWDGLKTLSADEQKKTLATYRMKTEKWKEELSEITTINIELMRKFKEEVAKYDEQVLKDTNERDKAVMEDRDQSGVDHIARFILNPEHKNDDFAILNGANHSKNMLRIIHERMPNLNIQFYPLRREDLD